MSIEFSGKSASSVLIGLNSSSKKEQHEDTKNNQDTDISSQSDEVNVTSMAIKLNELAQKVSTEPAFDIQRISALKTEIEHGSYEVNSSRVAEKFFRFESALHQ